MPLRSRFRAENGGFRGPDAAPSRAGCSMNVPGCPFPVPGCSIGGAGCPSRLHGRQSRRRGLQGLGGVLTTQSGEAHRLGEWTPRLCRGYPRLAEWTPPPAHPAPRDAGWPHPTPRPPKGARHNAAANRRNPDPAAEVASLGSALRSALWHPSFGVDATRGRSLIAGKAAPANTKTFHAVSPLNGDAAWSRISTRRALGCGSGAAAGGRSRVAIFGQMPARVRARISLRPSRRKSWRSAMNCSARAP